MGTAPLTGVRKGPFAFDKEVQNNTFRFSGSKNTGWTPAPQPLNNSEPPNFKRAGHEKAPPAHEGCA